MAGGMVNKKPKGPVKPPKAGNPPGAGNPVGGGGGGVKGGGLMTGTPPAPTAITFTWVPVPGQPQQILVTTSQAVVWSGGVPTGWSMTGAGTTPKIVITGGVVVGTPTTFTLTFNGIVSNPLLTLNVPQNDPTFKGTQGQFLQSGISFAGPQMK